MNKYETGTYTTLLFDKHGTKQSDEKSSTFQEATLIGDEAIKSPPFASYVVVRVLANSQDQFYPWSVSGDHSDA